MISWRNRGLITERIAMKTAAMKISASEFDVFMIWTSFRKLLQHEVLLVTTVTLAVIVPLDQVNDRCGGNDGKYDDRNGG